MKIAAISYTIFLSTVVLGLNAASGQDQNSDAGEVQFQSDGSAAGQFEANRPTIVPLNPGAVLITPPLQGQSQNDASWPFSNLKQTGVSPNGLILNKGLYQWTGGDLKEITKELKENRPNPPANTMIFSTVKDINQNTMDLSKEGLVINDNNLPAEWSDPGGAKAIDLEKIGIKGQNVDYVNAFLGYDDSYNVKALYTVPRGSSLSDKQLSSISLSGIEYLEPVYGFFGSKIRENFSTNYEQYVDTVLSTICKSRFRPSKLSIQIEASGGVIVAEIKANGVMEFDTAEMCKLHTQLLEERARSNTP